MQHPNGTLLEGALDIASRGRERRRREQMHAELSAEDVLVMPFEKHLGWLM